jgi:probable phosphoglycerate mutase
LNTKKVYIVRHGQTDFNARGIVQGSGVDSSLNEKGRAQAEAFYEAFKGVKFDKVYTSVLKRTKESVARFIELGIPTEAVDHIMSNTNEKNILICMHGRAIRILLCYLLNYPLKSMDMFEHENCCLYLLNYTGSMFSVEVHNSTAHLKASVDNV